MKKILGLAILLAGLSTAPALACFWVVGGDGKCNIYYELCTQNSNGTGPVYIAREVTVCFS